MGKCIRVGLMNIKESVCCGKETHIGWQNSEYTNMVNNLNTLPCVSDWTVKRKISL